jgi:hypothetical protein
MLVTNTKAPLENIYKDGIFDCRIDACQIADGVGKESEKGISVDASDTTHI